MFAKLRLSILSARLLARRCRPRHRSLPIRNRPHPAALIWQQARPRPVLLLPHPSRPQRKCSPPPLLFLLLLLASGVMPILAVVRLLQSSSEIFCGVFAKIFVRARMDREIFLHRHEAARSRRADVARVHRGARESSAYRWRRESGPIAPIHRKTSSIDLSAEKLLP